MLRRWRNKAAQTQALRRRIPTDVPSGHVAVTVGSNSRRFVVRASYLNHPIIRKLLAQSEEEFGFVNQTGPLNIACDEKVFEDIIRFLNRSDGRFVNLEDFQRSSYCRGALTDSRPLLEKEKSVW
ncbi:Auxin-induced protein 6B [Bienertia sinuspersici]